MTFYLTDAQVDEVLAKMFQAVGREFCSIRQSCRGDQWFMKSSWTPQQESKFEKWLLEYVRKKLKLPKKLAESRVKNFLFEYGWKYKKGV